MRLFGIRCGGLSRRQSRRFRRSIGRFGCRRRDRWLFRTISRERRERGGVGVAGGGVVGEQGVADAAVHLDLDHVAMGTEALPAPVDLDMAVG